MVELELFGETGKDRVKLIEVDTAKNHTVKQEE